MKLVNGMSLSDERMVQAGSEFCPNCLASRNYPVCFLILLSKMKHTNF